MVPASVNENYVIRFCAVAQHATEEDIGETSGDSRNCIDRTHFFFNFLILFEDIAWDIITDFATELLEKEQADEITEILDRKREETLARKRSFFVRMVSDPKLYNPAINKAGPGTPRISTDYNSPITEAGVPDIQTPTR